LPQMELYLVNTGPPQTSTGETVTVVAQNFAASGIWEEFAEIYTHFEQALRSNNLEALKQLICLNHQLLVTLGIVPKKVCDFIHDLETRQAAAKVCGAGSTAGDTAGIVLVLAKEPPITLCEKYGYSICSVRPESKGARLV
jgi:mevalonate kinase